jgi:acylphosphatase
MTTRLEVIVSGSVQGVGFRYFVLGIASRLGLVGWVANLADGRVQCVAEGPREDLEVLLGELRRGPAGAGVAAVSSAWLASTGGFDRFSVRSAAHRGD